MMWVAAADPGGGAKGAIPPPPLSLLKLVIKKMLLNTIWSIVDLLHMTGSNTYLDNPASP